jgi:hypothetical protein
MVRECSTHGEMRNTYTILVGKPKEKNQFARPKLRCDDNITVDLKVTGFCIFELDSTGFG